MTSPTTDRATLTAAVLDTNIAVVATWLSAAGATAAVISYNGQGDEGEEVEAELQLPRECDDSAAEPLVDLMEVEWNGTCYVHESREGLDFDSALEQTLSQVLTVVGRSWYADGEGGHGSLTITPDGVATLDHNDRVVVDENMVKSFYPTPLAVAA